MTLESKEQKGSKRYMGRDRLGELPDEVLLHILRFMPIRDAVKTMLLRRFGNLWASIPTLDFHTALKLDEQPFLSNDDIDDNISDIGEEPALSLVHFVRNVLMLHEASSIDSFKLWFPNELFLGMYGKILEEVYTWVKWAVKREVKVLHMKFLDGDIIYRFTIPFSLFATQSLVELAFYRCDLDCPRGVHLRSLKHLSLISVRYDDKGFSKIISSCPLLQELHVYNFGGDNLSFVAPSIQKLQLGQSGYGLPYNVNCRNVKTLDFYGTFWNVTIQDLSSVHEATIKSIFEDDEKYAHYFKNLLGSLRNLELLTLNDCTLQLLIYCYKKNLGFPINKWKHVNLTTFLHQVYIFGICTFLRNTPHLEELNIDVFSIQDNWRKRKICQELFVGEDYSCEAKYAPCVAPRLKVVNIHGYCKLDHPIQLQLIEILLKSGVVLDRLVMFSDRNNKLSSNKEHKLLKKILSFPRACESTKILFA